MLPTHICLKLKFELPRWAGRGGGGCTRPFFGATLFLVTCLLLHGHEHVCRQKIGVLSHLRRHLRVDAPELVNIDEVDLLEFFGHRTHTVDMIINSANGGCARLAKDKNAESHATSKHVLLIAMTGLMDFLYTERSRPW